MSGRARFLALAGVLIAAVSVLTLAVWSNSQASPSTTSPDDPPLLAEMTGRSTIILHGVVASTNSTVMNINGKQLPYLIARIRPIEVLKGDRGDELVEVRALGGDLARSAGIVFSDEVRFEPGEEVIVFLYPAGPPDNSYLTPIALSRAKFTVLRSNGAAPLVLAQDQASQWKRAPSESVKGNALHLDDFLGRVRDFME